MLNIWGINNERESPFCLQIDIKLGVLHGKVEVFTFGNLHGIWVWWTLKSQFYDYIEFTVSTFFSWSWNTFIHRIHIGHHTAIFFARASYHQAGWAITNFTGGQTEAAKDACLPHGSEVWFYFRDPAPSQASFLAGARGHWFQHQHLHLWWYCLSVKTRDAIWHPKAKATEQKKQHKILRKTTASTPLSPGTSTPCMSPSR